MFAKLTIKQALEGLKNKEFSSVELTQKSIDAFNQNEDLNTAITYSFDEALKDAKASDERRAKGENIGILEGIPVGIKDLFATENIQTTAGSHILEGFKPQYESFVTAKMKAEGAVSVAKLTLDEFAMGSATLNPHFGAAINPWQGPNGEKLVPGGSSGGSSAAIAAGLVLGATGTDTGGSIRQPAAYTGIVGLKPTYGRCSRWGIVAYASSLDQAGPMTRSVEDAAIMLNAMAGHDKLDSTSAPLEVPDFAKNLNGSIAGMKIGIPKEYMVDGLNEEVKKEWEKGAAWLKEQGAEIVDISLPHTQYALATYYIIAPAEASANLSRYDGVRYGLRVAGDSLDEMYLNTRKKGFGKEVQKRIMIGTYVLSAGFYDAYYIRAQKVRRLIKQDFEKAFEKVDAILTPTAPTAAFAIDNAPKDAVTMYLNDVFTVPISLAGLPAMSVPSGLNSDGLPLGLQIIGKQFDEVTVLKVGKAIENAANFSAVPHRLR
ncbi:MAG: Asp-tRNA(Asn)/Glu-tRNA(Gln) amidotransferase subunit GatA [Alphaproteobacteria bacterium]